MVFLRERSECFVHRRLIAAPLALRAFSKPLQYIAVNPHGYARLAFVGEHGPTTTTAKIMRALSRRALGTLLSFYHDIAFSHLLLHVGLK